MFIASTQSTVALKTTCLGNTPEAHGQRDLYPLIQPLSNYILAISSSAALVFRRSRLKYGRFQTALENSKEQAIKSDYD